MKTIRISMRLRFAIAFVAIAVQGSIATAAELIPATQLESTHASGVPSSVAPSHPGTGLAAVIPFELGGPAISHELRAVLSAVASRMQMDDSLTVNLRSFVPDSGSLEFGIGLAEQALQRVRSELIALGIKPRRIVRETLRELGPRSGGAKRHGVEVYLDSSAGR